MPILPFQKLTVVRLMTHPERPGPSPDDDAIQAAHVAYLRGLVASGIVLANGPLRAVDDPDFRGLSLYTVGPDQTRELATADPAVQARWLLPVIDEWTFPAVPRTIGDRVDLELDVPD